MSGAGLGPTGPQDDDGRQDWKPGAIVLLVFLAVVVAYFGAHVVAWTLS